MKSSSSNLILLNKTAEEVLSSAIAVVYNPDRTLQEISESLCKINKRLIEIDAEI